MCWKDLCSNMGYAWQVVDGPAALVDGDTTKPQLRLKFGGPGTVRLHLHVKRSCKDVDEDYTVTVNSLPVVDPIPDISVCTGDTIFLNATGGPANTGLPAICAWSGPNNFATKKCDTLIGPIINTNLGMYKYTLTDNNGCSSSTTFVASNGTSGPAAVSATQNPTGKICAGTGVNFTASSPNSGSHPLYEWRVNGVAKGTSSPIFTYSSFTNGDKVVVHMKSNSHCVSKDTVTSAPLTIQIDTATSAATVKITANPSQSVCIGSNISFTSTTTNGGTSLNYTWKVNNSIVGSNSSYSSNALHNGDTVRCIFTSNAACAVQQVAISAPFIVKLDSARTPVNTISTPTDTVCPNQSASFAAAPTLGGASPLYQWKLNGVSAGGFSNQNIYEVPAVHDRDTVTCVLISNANCITKDTVTSNRVILVISYTDTAAFVQITSHPGDTICVGGSINITSLVKGGGVSPGYQWYFNNTLTSSGSTFTFASPNAGDSITCIVNTGALCASSTIDTSNTIYIKTRPLPLSVITPDKPNPVCNGDSIELCANQGMATYTWHNNNKQGMCIYAKQSGNYYLTVTDNNGCTAESNHVGVTILPPASISVNSFGDTIRTYNGKAYKWYRDGQLIPNATDSFYVAKEGGSYVVEVTDANNCTLRSTPTIITGIDELIPAGMKLYPNPNNGTFTLEFSDDIPREVTIEDALGRKITTMQVTRQKQFSLNQAADGIYFVRISKDNEVKVVKFSVQR